MLAIAPRTDTAPAPGNARAADVLAGLAIPAPVLHAERDEEIVTSRRGGAFCYNIMQGCVRTVSLMEDGRRQIGEFLFPGDLLELDAVFGAEAVTAVTLRRIPVSLLEERAAADPAFGRRLRSYAAGQMRAARSRFLLLGRKTAAERVASFLLEMEDRVGLATDRTITLPMSRSDIADYLGLTTETVCRALSELRHTGLIRVQRTSIVIVNHASLVSSGGEWVN